MRVLVFALLLLAIGCGPETGSDQVALAEAQARTAEAEARAAEARAAEAAARAAESAAAATAPAPTTPAPALPAPPPPSEPPLDYDPFGTPRTAYVQTQTAGRITLRAEPRAGARRVVRVVDGTPLTVLGCQGEARVRTDAAAAGTPGRWCFVRTGTHDGWAFDAYLVF